MAIESRDTMPRAIRAVAALTARLCEKYHPELLDVLVGGYLNLRYLSPALCTPWMYGLLDKVPGRAYAAPPLPLCSVVCCFAWHACLCGVVRVARCVVCVLTLMASARANLVLLAKVLQSVSNGFANTNKEPYFLQIEHFVTSYVPKMSEFLHSLGNDPRYVPEYIISLLSHLNNPVSELTPL